MWPHSVCVPQHHRCPLPAPPSGADKGREGEAPSWIAPRAGPFMTPVCAGGGAMQPAPASQLAPARVSQQTACEGACMGVRPCHMAHPLHPPYTTMAALHGGAAWLLHGQAPCWPPHAPSPWPGCHWDAPPRHAGGPPQTPWHCATQSMQPNTHTHTHNTWRRRVTTGIACCSVREQPCRAQKALMMCFFKGPVSKQHCTAPPCRRVRAT